jgi:hypothetical protein
MSFNVTLNDLFSLPKNCFRLQKIVFVLNYLSTIMVFMFLNQRPRAVQLTFFQNFQCFHSENNPHIVCVMHTPRNNFSV